MRTLDQMCVILNRLLDIDEEATHQLLKQVTTCTPTAWESLLDDPEITVHLDAEGVHLTPMLLINSLVSEQRGDGEYSIFRDLDDSGRTIYFFVARVNRGGT